MWGKDIKEIIKQVTKRITPTHVGKSILDINYVVSKKDHPHPCGEKFKICAFNPPSVGSPPPMWGKVSPVKLPYTMHRITPTHVGKSSQIPDEIKISKDHPHPCGEKRKSPLFLDVCIGSPPPMWGKAHHTLVQSIVPRITPTHVGKSLLSCAGKS